MSYGSLKEKKHIWANSKKDDLVHIGYNIVYPIILFFFVNNFEPNLVLLNVNKLKPYASMDQTLKGIQNLIVQMFLQSTYENHMEETFDEDLEDKKEIETIGTDQTIVLKKTLVNLISQ
jgi:hypothetical protein